MITEAHLEGLYRLQEAYTLRRVLTRRARAEKTLQKLVERFFKAQAPKVVRAFSSGVLEEADTKLDQKFDRAVAAVNKQYTALLQAAIEQVLLQGASDAIQYIPLGISFNLRNPRAVKWAKGYAAQLITQVDSTTKEQVRRIVAEHIEQGKSYTALAKELKKHYTEFNRPPLRPTGVHIRSRAEHIAITEVANAYSAGSFFAVANAQDKTGVRFEKSWLTVGDRRVSEGCRTNSAQGWLPVEDDHDSGHLYPPRFPGCRCTEQYRRKA